MALNNQLNSLREEKHQAMVKQQEMEQIFESRAQDIAAQKQRDIDEMNRKLQAIQEQKERAEK